MDIINIIGSGAGILTTASFIPQVVKTWRSKSVEDISLLMFLVLLAGNSLWIIYGVLMNSLPVIIANTATVMLVTAQITLKIKYGRPKNRP